MSEETNEFRDWMDEHRLKAIDVCEALHVSEQAIHNWRSQGVPPRRHPHVERYMAEWVDPSAVVVPSISEANIQALRERQNLVLRPSDEQFEAWDRASRKDGAETLHEWAMRGLNSLANLDSGKFNGTTDS